jgi:hypothetical protein
MRRTPWWARFGCWRSARRSAAGRGRERAREGRGRIEARARRHDRSKACGSFRMESTLGGGKGTRYRSDRCSPLDWLASDGLHVQIHPDVTRKVGRDTRAIGIGARRPVIRTRLRRPGAEARSGGPERRPGAEARSGGPERRQLRAARRAADASGFLNYIYWLVAIESN